ncbi:MCE family protein [Mycolicibacillus parakoreensis]|uniref:MlaD family protein n=1 Tax=Mycolicibacillus parakoreensis TaxID=1069221 RepID=A0ABY3U278_9MYCO|nr:MCE family protein [Mycolicibacillus parakoreensis]MCV7316536.1 MCE family protein [Mycolicibacillus parakoreensis]ULN52761.1 MlaD family protein [Mycolicibacillus parakoreensis]HLR98359.1 MCE family protein [Mycolicibacillus parakoreensis]
MITPRGALWRLVASALVAGVVAVLIVNVLRQPVDAPTDAYTADFTDASGLTLDADVRVRGVRVGKVTAIRLVRQAGRSLAEVGFTLEDRFGIDPHTRVAIKFQALTGLRYLAVLDPADPGDTAAMAAGAHLPTAMTRPSLDITTLFNGLQPVLATLTPEQLNTFTDHVATVLAGDGSGLAPMLDSIRTLTSFVADRQTVITTLLANLGALSESVGGRSREFIELLRWANRPVDAAMGVLDEFRKSALYGPQFTQTLVRLLHHLGIEPGASIDDGLDKAITNFNDTLDGFKMIPVVWENIEPPGSDGEPVACSRGRAQLPETLDVLLGGQRVVLCNR